ncbi:MAG: DUF6607 family protein [Pseudomonadota bacterium]
MMVTDLSGLSWAPVLTALFLSVSGCAATSAVDKDDRSYDAEVSAADLVPASSAVSLMPDDALTFERDRETILSMAGDYKVTFDFTETVSFVEGYQLKEPKLSGAHESVRVVEDRGDFISLQHLLVVGPDDSPFVVKHWRQDWQYEPERVLAFVGGNAWAWREVPDNERIGAWSQTVFQVDDAPRYGAVAPWTYEDGLAEWQPPQEWRPLPRRDMTTRQDYHAMDAVNRHAMTPDGWVHEQDNSKLVLSGDPHVLVREVGINTYKRFDDYPVEAADAYWAATASFWSEIRKEWTRIAEANEAFAITIKGETQDLYMPLLGLAGDVQAGDMSVDAAVVEAKTVIDDFVTPELPKLTDRLRPLTTEIASAR